MPVGAVKLPAGSPSTYCAWSKGGVAPRTPPLADVADVDELGLQLLVLLSILLKGCGHLALQVEVDRSTTERRLAAWPLVVCLMASVRIPTQGGHHLMEPANQDLFVPCTKTLGALPIVNLINWTGSASMVIVDWFLPSKRRPTASDLAVVIGVLVPNVMTDHQPILMRRLNGSTGSTRTWFGPRPPMLTCRTG